MEIAFAEGLKLGTKLFSSILSEIRIRNIETELQRLTTNLDVLQLEHRRFRRQLNDLSKFRIEEVEGRVRNLLHNRRLSTPENVSAVASFVMSIGYYIKGMTITGNIIPEFYFGRTEDTLLLSGFLSASEIIDAIARLEKFASIKGVRIDSKQVKKTEDMKGIGAAISAFYKVLQIFGKRSVPLSDAFPIGNEVIVQILFDGMYKMEEIVNITPGPGPHENLEIQPSPTASKNVYILGQNGAGKSTWGNILQAQQSTPLLFRTGRSVHTTMMPQHCDVGQDNAFRLWDLPGLYDGTSYATTMQQHITETINGNVRYSAVLFIFNGKTQSNDIVNDILRYAVQLFGPSVYKSFIAIVNDFDGNASTDSAQSYASALHSVGFRVNQRSFFVLGKEENFQEYQSIRDILNEFPVQIVWKFQSYFNELLIEHKNDINKVLEGIHKKTKEELYEFMGNTRVSAMVNNVNGWFFGRGKIEPESITIRTHTVGYFGRRQNDEIEDRFIKLDESTKSAKVSVLILQRTWFFEQRSIFLNGILEEPGNILMLSTEPKYHYVLFNVSQLTYQEKKEKVYSQIRALSNDTSSDAGSSDVHSLLSFG